MEKFDSEKHGRLAANLPFSYFSSNVYLDFAAYTFRRNDEDLIVWQDLLYPHEFPSIFLPKNKENWLTSSISLVNSEDLNQINRADIPVLLKKPAGREYYYETRSFLDPAGKLKNRIESFRTTYSFKLKGRLETEEILTFYQFWKKQRSHESMSFEESESFFMFCLNNREKYNIRQVYVECENKVVGFAWGIAHQDKWIGLHLKVDYQYRGLSRFLHHERAKLFFDRDTFTLGTGAYDIGIENHKKDLGPIEVIDYFYILTGEKHA